MEYLEYVKLHKKIRKILILGSGAVGKTSLTKVLKSQIPLKDTNGDCDYNRTLFVEIDQFKTDDDIGTFQVIDLAGQLGLPIHATRDSPKFVFNAVDLICYVFATDNVQSLIDLSEWVEIVNNFYSIRKLDTPPFILIRNKVDLESFIDNSLLENIMSDLRAYFEVSCYDGQGIDQLKQWFNVFFKECEYEILEQ
ncbi:MAG: GTPase domain-containing protein [Asgard group archaeon]|nr:GTPase domain-containing protein [Asgard group archaeon]